MNQIRGGNGDGNGSGGEKDETSSELCEQEGIWDIFISAASDIRGILAWIELSITDQNVDPALMNHNLNLLRDIWIALSNVRPHMISQHPDTHQLYSITMRLFGELRLHLDHDITYISDPNSALVISRMLTIYKPLLSTIHSNIYYISDTL